MESKNNTPGKKELQIKMTVFVTSAVLLVTAIVQVAVAFRVYRDYNALLQDRIDDDLNAITRIMEQRLLRVEEATLAMSGTASRLIGSRNDIDSLLCSTLAAVHDVRGVSIVFDKNAVPCGGGYYERFAVNFGNNVIKIGEFVNGDDSENDSDWQYCFVEGKRTWSEPGRYSSNGVPIISYYVPLYDSNGKRIAMAYSAVGEDYLTSFVTRYKARKDIDISIYNADGRMVVAPDDYILELSPDKLMVKESHIDNIGWKVVLSVDKKVIYKKVREALAFMMMLFILMFIVIYLAIRYTVRYVAKPFVKKQQLIEQERAIMENEMALAERAQNELVPNVFPPFPDRKGIDIAACLHPARKVGGDLYDYFILDDKLFFCIGDVSGKGVQASMFMTATHYLFRSLTSEKTLADAAGQMNTSLCTDNAKCRFVTLWMGCLNLASGELEYVNAGHDDPVFVRDSRLEEFPFTENMPLGVWEEEAYISNTVKLLPGDTLLLYTDGVTEAMDAGGREYGKETLRETIENASCDSAANLVETVLGAVRQHSRGVDQSDDITMLCLKFIESETNHR